MRAIRIAETGGPEVLRLENLPVPEPGPGQARVRVRFAGVNFIDTYQRTGLYAVPLPFIPGNEGAGEVEAAGAGLEGLAPGDRVAWASERGSYAEYAVVGGQKLVPVPLSVPLEKAAAVLLQGMTAHYLTHDTFPLRDGHVAVVHAAAGGVGLLLVQMAKLLGARVIGTVSTEEKAALARAAGADDVVLYTRENFRERALASTGGRGVDVVYDSVGRATWEDSLRSLRPRGMLVLFGNASGPAPAIDPLRLSQAGSVYLTRPTLAHYTADRAELLRRAADVLGELEDGRISVRVDRVLDLDRAGDAHRLLEDRATAGKLLLRC